MTTLSLTLSNDQQAITIAGRLLNRSKERLADSETRLRRLREDAELFGRVESNDLDAIRAEVEADRQLVATLETRLAWASKQPEIRARKEKRGAELKADAETLIGRIEKNLQAIERDLKAAKALGETIMSEFENPDRFGYLVAPFRGSTLAARLLFWSKDLKPGTFADLIDRYRSLSR